MYHGNMERVILGERFRMGEVGEIRLSYFSLLNLNLFSEWCEHLNSCPNTSEPSTRGMGGFFSHFMEG